MNVGDLIRHRYQPDTQGGHGIILGIKLVGERKFYKVRWIGAHFNPGPQWFKHEELKLISDVNKDEKNS